MSERGDLYELLPALYRLEDTEQGFPLRALLALIEEQAAIIKGDTDALWDDYFVETCADWVVPYIGDLVANLPLYEVARRRADVARTIHYRRRKGTLSVVEELARNVTGWGAHAIAFFESLGWTQNLNHPRYQVAPNPGGQDPTAVDRVGTINLRKTSVLDRLDGPFDTTSHSVDVRKIERARGWHNIRNVGVFLWRLSHYPLTGLAPRRAEGPHDYGYHFSSLGNPAPVFTYPLREPNEATLASEAQVPGPIRPAAFGSRPEDYYGRDRSLHIVKNDAEVPLDSIICQDLRDWERPPSGITGVMSGDLSSFPALTSDRPAVEVAIGGEGPHTAPLSAVPTDLTQAQGLLEAAIRGAHTTPAFTAARVVVVANRLLVLPGTRGKPVAFEDTDTDHTTVTELALHSHAVQRAQGVMSGDLSSFPALTSDRPAVEVAIGGEGPHTAPLSAVPTDLTQAQGLLEAAIRGAHTTPAFTAAQVLIVGEQLLVLPGITGQPIVLGPSRTDATTVAQLALSNKVAVDVHVGRLTFAVGDEPKTEDSVSVSYNYGFSAELGGGPYNRRRPPRAARPDTVANPVAFGRELISVPSDGIGTIDDALSVWAGGGRKPTVIQLEDNRTYDVNLTINLGEGELVIQAENHKRPTLVGSLRVIGANDGARLTLNGLIIEGHVEVERELGELMIEHCTLVPGRSLNERGEPRSPEQPSVIVQGTGERLRVVIDRSIVGPLRLPGELAGLDVRDSIVDSPSRKGQADVRSALISAEVPSLSLSSEHPAVNVTIGDEGPYRRVLPLGEDPPTTVEEVREPLEQAIREASESPAFRNARVITVPDVKRLILLSGSSETVVIEAADEGSDEAANVGEGGYLRPEDVSPEHALEVLDQLNTAETARELAAVEIPAERDVGVRIAQRILDRREVLGGFTDLREVDDIHLVGPERFTEIVTTLSGARAPTPNTARELGLDPDSSRRAYALISAEVPSLSLSSEHPAVNVTIGDEGPYRRVLHLDENQPEPITVENVREPLERAIREASQSPAFRNALVGNLQNQLVVLPGAEEAAVFGAATDDWTTLTELELDRPLPAIAANQGGVRPGPPTTLERTTVFGAVHVQELALASEVIFTAPVKVTRRQVGCVRFSYVPPESSRTPRRYRCQPDQVLDQRAREEENLSPGEEALIQARLRPSFTSTYYGDPSYAQLDLTTAEELRTGAEDGSEMGAFSYLKQPQREANLRVRLDEYLPFGLEAGLIYVT